MKPIAHGIYEALLDEQLRDVLKRHPDLRTVLQKIDPEEQPSPLPGCALNYGLYLVRWILAENAIAELQAPP